MEYFCREATTLDDVRHAELPAPGESRRCTPETRRRRRKKPPSTGVGDPHSERLPWLLTARTRASAEFAPSISRTEFATCSLVGRNGMQPLQQPGPSMLSAKKAVEAYPGRQP